MRITFVIQDLFNQGAQAATAMIVRGFINKGYEVDLIVSKVHLDYRINGFKGEFSVPENTNWIFLKSRKARKNILQLRHYLSQTDAMAVIAMSPNYTNALRIASIGLRHCPHLVHVEHGLASCNDKGERISSRNYYSLRALLGGLFWSKFYRILVVSSFAIDDFRNVEPWCPMSQFYIVHNPVVSDELFVKMKSQPFHPWLVRKKCKTFVSAGAYVANKGHMCILEAINKLVRENISIRLILFGAGELENQYLEFVQKNGYSNNLPAEEHAADGYILSSITESFGIALVEAMACGLPVIATDAPYGPREILKNGKYGKLVPVGDVDAMAKAIMEVYNSDCSPPPIESWQPYTIEATVLKYEIGVGALINNP